MFKFRSKVFSGTEKNAFPVPKPEFRPIDVCMRIKNNTYRKAVKIIILTFRLASSNHYQRKKWEASQTINPELNTQVKHKKLFLFNIF